MKINEKFTHSPVVGSVRRLKGGIRVFDFEDKLLCFLRAGELYDLNLTPFSPCGRASASECRKPGNTGAFVTDGEYLYRDGNIEGRLEDRTLPIIILLSFACLISVISFLILATKQPRPVIYPSFTVADKDGEWSAVGKIDVFGGKMLKPGENGTYMFVVNNPHNAQLRCDIILNFNYENNQKLPPLQYEVFSEGRRLDAYKEDKFITVRDVIIKERSSRSFAIEWLWQFESGDDHYDTAIGIEGGKYAVTIEIVAQEA